MTASEDAPRNEASDLDERSPDILVVIPSLSGSVAEFARLHEVATEAGAAFLVVANSRSLFDEIRTSDVPYVTSRGNDGFAASVTLAAKSRDWSWLVILNDDLQVDEAALRESLGSAGLGAARTTQILHFDGERARGIPGPGAVFLNVSMVANLLRRLQRKSRPTKEPSYRSFSAVAISRGAWEAVGGLDLRYPFTFEDADFVKRASRLGYEDVAADRPFATHLHSQTTSRWVGRVLPVAVESAYQYLVKWHGNPIAHRCLLLAALAVRVPIALVTSTSRRAHMRGILSSGRVLLTGTQPLLPRWEEV